MKVSFQKELGRTAKVKEVIETLLEIRKVEDKASFLSPKHPREISLFDFGLKDEFEKTLSLLKEVKKQNKKVIVYTDYDADGITGGAILWETLYRLGFDALPYVPHRQKEGYGFSFEGLRKIKKLYDPGLIISVDHGISAAQKVAFAKEELGIPVIITDHHLKPKKLPDKAEAIFHIEALSGSGVSYFFSKAVFEALDRSKSLEDLFESDYLALASIGTIADLVPLVGPSRSIAKYGLEAFGRTRRHGIRELTKVSGIEGRKITPWEIGFVIAPRINAAGRLEDATDALRLLCTKKQSRARSLAEKLSSQNRLRQNMLEAAVEKAKELLQKLYGKKLPKILIVFDKDFHEGIIGLIAARLSEEYHRPTIVFTLSDGFLKASARSIKSFHITNFLRLFENLLLEVGGHSQAAGLKIEKEKFNEFQEKAVKKAEELLKEKQLEKTLLADLKLPLQVINLDLAKAIESLQPFGVGNPEPLFFSQGILEKASLFGKENRHLKIWIKGESGSSIEFILFDGGDEFFRLSREAKVEIVYSLEVNRWRNREYLRGKIKHFRVLK